MLDEQKTYPGLDYDFEALIKRWNVPGLSLAVIHSDQVQCISLGSAAEGIAVTPDTLFCIASNSKLFTAVAVGILVDDGKFKWTDRITDILPGFALRDDHMSKHVTVRDILSHRTGLPRHDYAFNLDDTTSDLLARLKNLRPSAELHELYQYNNFMFILAAGLVAEHSGQSFTSFVEERVFKPLNMHRSGFHQSSSTLAQPYLVTYDGTSLPIPNFMDEFDRETNAAPGGVLSNAKDLAKWVQFLVKKHKSAFEKPTEQQTGKDGLSEKPADVISSASFKEICTGWSIARGTQLDETSPNGHGVIVSSYRGVEMLTHSGGDPGYESEVTWIPSRGIGVAALTNASNTGYYAASTAAYRLLDHLLGLDPVDWEARYRDKHRKKLEDQAPEKSPAFQRSSASLSSVVGVYEDPGYGRVTVAPMPDQLAGMHLPPSLAAACERFYKRIKGARSISKYQPECPQLLVDWQRVFFTSHLVLQHVEHDRWQATHAHLLNISPGDRVLEYEKVADIEVRFDGTSMSWSNIAGASADTKPGQVDVVFKKQAVSHEASSWCCIS